MLPAAPAAPPPRQWTAPASTKVTTMTRRTTLKRIDRGVLGPSLLHCVGDVLSLLLLALLSSRDDIGFSCLGGEFRRFQISTAAQCRVNVATGSPSGAARGPNLLTPYASVATFTVTGAWRSWLSRWPVKPEAAGSSPVAPALFSGDARVGVSPTAASQAVHRPRFSSGL